MNKLVTMVGGTIGSYVGWALGARAGIMTAFMLSMVGTGLGMFAAHRAATRMLD